MATLHTPDGVELHYTDTEGDGRPLVLIHGWPLSGEAFADNVDALQRAGARVVAYDRRGFGRSDKPEGGYDYDTLAADLDALLTGLDLHDAVLLGFSMGGGEVARYLSRYGSDRVAAAIFSGSIAPALCITDDNPDGAMPMEGFENMAEQCRQDRDGFLDQFTTWFFSTDAGLQVDEATREGALEIARQSDPEAAWRTILIWATDLRDDCRRIDVPTLVIHGDGDVNVPLAKSSQRMPEFVPNAHLVVLEGAPHGANVSHQRQWEQAISDFLATLG